MSAFLIVVFGYNPNKVYVYIQGDSYKIGRNLNGVRVHQKDSELHGNP